MPARQPEHLLPMHDRPPPPPTTTTGSSSPHAPPPPPPSPGAAVAPRPPAAAAGGVGNDGGGGVELEDEAVHAAEGLEDVLADSDADADADADADDRAERAVDSRRRSAAAGDARRPSARSSSSSSSSSTTSASASAAAAALGAAGGVGSRSFLGPFGTPQRAVIGRDGPRAIVRVERDWQAGDVAQFHSSFPLELSDRISPTVFQELINDLNSRLLTAHSARHALLDNLLMVGSAHLSLLWGTSHFQKELLKLERLIDHRNAEVWHPAGLAVRSPRAVAFQFLEIEYY